MSTLKWSKAQPAPEPVAPPPTPVSPPEPPPIKRPPSAGASSPAPKPPPSGGSGSTNNDRANNQTNNCRVTYRPVGGSQSATSALDLAQPPSGWGVSSVVCDLTK